MGIVCGTDKAHGGHNSEFDKILEIIESGDEKALKKLLRKGADVNEPSCSGYTALMQAASSGQLPCMERLLYAGADVNVCSYEGSTALLESVVNGHSACTRRLVRSGADVNARDGQRALYHVVTKGNVQFLNLLIKLGAKVNVPYKQGKTPLIVAVEMKQSDCATVLVEAGADTKCLDNIENYSSDDVNTKSNEKHEHSDVVVLYDRTEGAGVNSVNRSHSPTVDEIDGTHAGADVNINFTKRLEESQIDIICEHTEATTTQSDRRKQTKEKNVENSHNKEDFKLSNTGKNKKVVSYNGHIEPNVIILEAQKLDESFEEYGTTVFTSRNEGAGVNNVNRNPSFSKTKLFVAVNNNDVTCTGTMIESGADVNISGPNGRTPLMMAAYDPSNKCFKLLLDAGADVNTIDKTCDYTALMFAAKVDNFQAVKCLIDAGADVNVVNKEGTTALDIARGEGHYRCVDLLTKGKATTDVASATPCDKTTKAAIDVTPADPNNNRKATVQNSSHIATLQNSNGIATLQNTNLKDLCREAIRSHLQQMSSAEFLVQVRRLGLAPLLRSYLLHYDDKFSYSSQEDVRIRGNSSSKGETIPKYSSFAPEILVKSW